MAAVTVAAHSPRNNLVSQKGRMFHPSSLQIDQGSTVRFVNDDGDLIHHMYVDAQDFKFDSYDQRPGSSFDVTFSVAGSFTVLCAIHPKMRLPVTVR